MDIYHINRILSSLIENVDLGSRTKLELQKLLTDEIAKRIKPDLIELISIRFPELKPAFSFQKIESKVGQTYGLFVSENNSDGITLLLKLDYDSQKPPEFLGSAKNYENHLKKCFDFCRKLILRRLTNSYFPHTVINKISLKFLNPLNTPEIELQLTGISLDLPLSIALFSVLIEREVPNNIAASGKITDDLEVTYIDGLEQKLDSLINEYPEVAKVILPADCKHKVHENYGLEFIFVRTLEEAIEVCFPGIFDVFESIPLKEKVHLLKNIINLENSEKALYIKLDYIIGQTLDSEILNYIKLEKLITDYKQKGIKYVFLDNFRATWLVAGMMPFLVNKINAVGISDSMGNYTIVYSRTSAFKLGEIVKIKNNNNSKS